MLVNKKKQQKVDCSALIISAPSSGSGKTTITAAIATYHRQQGRNVRVFKTGPDFIDPMILEQASGNPVYQLDLWMVGENECQALLYEAAQCADLILIEGVMGLFDGTPSTADLSEYFNIPVLAVVDGSAMAQTFGAVTYGLANYRKNLKLTAVMANKIASERHGEMVLAGVPESIKQADYFHRDAEITLAERHLGLVQASELNNIEDKLSIAAQQIAKGRFAQLPEKVTFDYPSSVDDAHSAPNALANKTIIIARDIAFNFLYRANIRLLEQAGATLVYCSPLDDQQLPEGDALYLPGGYPELHAQKLSENHQFLQSLQLFSQTGKPILAECGGMLYLLDSLTTIDNESFPMAKVIKGTGQMNKKLSAIGQQYADMSTIFELTKDKEIRGHSFHYSTAEIHLPEQTRTTYYPRETKGEAIYLKDNMLVSYMHWYFPSNRQFIYDFFNQQLRLKKQAINKK